MKFVYTLFTFLLLSATLNANCGLVSELAFNPAGSLAGNNNDYITSIDSSAPFVTIWNTELAGNNKSISIPGIGVNYSIYWEEIDNPGN